MNIIFEKGARTYPVESPPTNFTFLLNNPKLYGQSENRSGTVWKIEYPKAYCTENKGTAPTHLLVN